MPPVNEDDNVPTAAVIPTADPTAVVDNDNDPAIVDNVVITHPHGVGLHELGRRKANPLSSQREERSRYVILQSFCDRALRNCKNARNLIDVQDGWDKYIQDVREMCSDKFWKVFLSVHRHSGSFIDSALAGVKNAFNPDGQFPSRRARLLESIRKVPDFWRQVMHSYVVDLSQFQLSHTKSLKFTFMDPVWAWLFVAARMDPLDLHWVPATQHINPFYGAGVQQGKTFRAACRSCPTGAFPMLFSLHWDGTNAHGQESAPIVVGVCNTNCSGGEETQFCIGYMPKLPKQYATPEFTKTKKSTTIKHYIRQECAHAILRSMVSAAQHGVKVRLRNKLGTKVRRLLMPRLYAMNFDQPEAQIFFGLQNRCCCSKCRRRVGFSALRSNATRHCRKQIQRLYLIGRPRCKKLHDRN